MQFMCHTGADAIRLKLCLSCLPLCLEAQIWGLMIIK